MGRILTDRHYGGCHHEIVLGLTLSVGRFQMGRQWTADITVTNKLVQTVLARQFPQLNLVEVELLDAGWDNTVYLVNKNYIFRFPRRRVAVELIEKENRLLPCLSARLPLTIPNPCYLGESTNEYPYPFSGYVKIDGNVPHVLNLNDEQRAKSTTQLAQFLRTLHSVPVDLAITRGISTSDDIGRMDVDKRIPMFVAKIEEAYNKGMIDNPQVLLSEINELPTSEWIRQQNSTVVHGDLNFRNFLVNHDGALVGVIDWGDAHVGHPAVDLSLVYSYLPPYARPDFFSVYGEVPPETLVLAKFRALYVNLVILIYAHDIGDRQQFLEAQRSISNTLGHSK